jgi:RHS repeat-associated protein
LYDPFGRALSAVGSLAGANLYRFSSKEAHAGSGLTYYLYRFYDPNQQCWINRDPTGERGGINQYTYVKNSPVIAIDPNGLSCWSDCMSESHTEHMEATSACLTRAEIVGASGLGICLAGCTLSSAAYPGCVVACWAAVGIVTASYGGCCMVGYIGLMTTAGLGCAVGCIFD